MDLQSSGRTPVTSENACPPDNFRAYSPQTADVSRGQPDTCRGHCLSKCAGQCGQICASTSPPSVGLAKSLDIRAAPVGHGHRPGAWTETPSGGEALLDRENHPARQGVHLVRDFGPLAETTQTGRVAGVRPGTRYASARGRGRIGHVKGFNTGLVAVVVVGHKGAAV